MLFNWLLTMKRLIGLPEAVRTAAAEVAKTGMENCWLFGCNAKLRTRLCSTANVAIARKNVQSLFDARNNSNETTTNR